MSLAETWKFFLIFFLILCRRVTYLRLFSFFWTSVFTVSSVNIFTSYCVRPMLAHFSRNEQGHCELLEMQEQSHYLCCWFFLVPGGSACSEVVLSYKVYIICIFTVLRLIGCFDLLWDCSVNCWKHGLVCCSCQLAFLSSLPPSPQGCNVVPTAASHN